MRKNIKYKIAKAIGSYLKYERMNNNISIAKISEDLQLNPSTIVSIENYKHQASFINIFMILEYLKIDHFSFFVKVSKIYKNEGFNS